MAERASATCDGSAWLDGDRVAGLPVLLPPRGARPDELGGCRDRLEQGLAGEGGVLLRGWGVDDTDAFAAALASLGLEPVPYQDRTTRRRTLGRSIYTSTEHPARQEILPHNENAYAAKWPGIFAFACAIQAERGGETTLYDGRRVLESIDPACIRELERREILHVRNFGTGLGLSVEEAFGVAEPAKVERRLAESGCAWCWNADGSLTTRRRTRPVLVHPHTNERSLFSHVAIFHQSTLPAEVRSAMLELYGPRGLPHAMFYGDGEAIPDAMIAQILAAYRAHEHVLHWERGDLMVADNMLIAHGRRPFEGERLVLAAFSREYARAEVRFD